jgi:alpha-ketoglutarate-dependent taurine dioxygenase
MLPAAAFGNLEDAVRRSRLAQIASSVHRATVHALRSDSALPLLVEAISSATDLVEWATWHREELELRLRESGGILFRGFRIDGPERLEVLIQSFSGRLLDYSYRSTPRTVVSGKIYTSTEYPPHQTIPLHNENAYAHDWPMKIWFFSLQCAAGGGETPIADSRRVYQRIPATVRRRFERLGVTYVRNYGSGFDLPWQEVFQTTSRNDVERLCAANGIQFEWLPEDRLRTRQTCRAVASHPTTGEMVWFNQAHLFHISRLQPEVREAMLSIFSEEDLPRNVYYGDGSVIDPADLDCICEAYDEEKIVFPWSTGDVLLLDNMFAAHGRNPFTGARKVVVGMAEPHSEMVGTLKCKN